MSNADAIIGIVLVTVVFGINPVAAIFVFGLLVIVGRIVFRGID